MAQAKITLRAEDKASPDIKKVNESVKGLKGSIDSLSSVGNKLRGIGSTLTIGVTGPIVAAGSALAAMTMQVAGSADQIDKMSERTGISRQSLQELQYAASQTGVDFQALDGISAAFSGRLLEMQGGTSTAAKTFEALGLSTTDAAGDLKTSGQVFEETIAALAGIEDEAERGRAAIALLGPEGAKLAPLLNQGAAGIEALKARAHELGVVLDDETIKTLVGMQDAVDDVKKAFAGLGNDIVTEFAPIIKETVVPLLKEQIVPALRDVAERIAAVIGWFTDLSTEQQRVLGGVAAALAVSGPLLIGFANLITLVDRAQKAFVALKTAGFAMSLTNPVGWVALAIAGLAALAAILFFNSGESVTTAAEEAAKKMGSGDKDSFVSGLDALVDAVDDDARPALEDLRADFIQTGTVSVEQAQRIKDAFAQAFITEKVAEQTSNILGAPVRDAELAQFQAITRHTGIDYYQMFMDAVRQSDFVAASQILDSAEQAARQLEATGVWTTRAADYAVDGAIGLYRSLLQEALTEADLHVAEIIDSVGDGLGAASNASGNRGTNDGTTPPPVTPPVTEPEATPAPATTPEPETSTYVPGDIAGINSGRIEDIVYTNEQLEAQRALFEDVNAQVERLGREHARAQRVAASADANRIAMVQEYTASRFEGIRLTEEAEAAATRAALEEATARFIAEENALLVSESLKNNLTDRQIREAERLLRVEEAANQNRIEMVQEYTASRLEGERLAAEAAEAAALAPLQDEEARIAADQAAYEERVALKEAQEAYPDSVFTSIEASRQFYELMDNSAPDLETQILRTASQMDILEAAIREAGNTYGYESEAVQVLVAEYRVLEGTYTTLDTTRQQAAAIAADTAQAIIDEEVRIAEETARAVAEREEVVRLSAEAFEQLKSNIAGGADVIADFVGSFDGMNDAADTIRFTGQQFSTLLQIIKSATAAQEAYRIATELAAAGAATAGAAMKLATMDIIGLVIQAIAWIVQLVTFFTSKATQAAREAQKIVEDIANSMESSIRSGLANALGEFARGGFESVEAFKNAFRESVYNAVLDGIIDAIVQGAIIESVLAPLLEDIVEAAKNKDWTEVNNLVNRVGAETENILNQLDLDALSNYYDNYLKQFDKVKPPDPNDYEPLYDRITESVSGFGTFVSQAVSIPLYDAAVHFTNSVDKFDLIVDRLINPGMTVQANANVTINNQGVPAY